MKFILAATSVLIALYATTLAFGQEDMTHVSNLAFDNPSRPKAIFNHDDHNRKASIEDCAACHHVYKNGTLLKDDSSEGTPCSECHSISSKGPAPRLMVAFHSKCKLCHVKQKSGPVTCGECHRKGNEH